MNDKETLEKWVSRVPDEEGFPWPDFDKDEIRFGFEGGWLVLTPDGHWRLDKV